MSEPRPYEVVPELRPRAMGMRVERREDPRLLTGRGRYVGDMKTPGALYVAFARSPVAHAGITHIGTDAAIASPGVEGVWTGADVEPLCAGLQAGFDTAGLEGSIQPLVATDTVRHVGEAVAAVVAETQARAEDAAALIEVEYDLRTPVSSLEASLNEELLANDTLERNRAYDRLRTFGEPDLLESAAFTEQGRFVTSRCNATPMEARAYQGEYDWTTGMLTLTTATQMPHLIRTLVAAHLGVSEHTVRVVTPDVGGAFGQKGHLFTEEVLVCVLARELDRPVRWLEDRRENLLVATHAKQQINDMAIGFNEDGIILALHDEVTGDAGAYQSCPFTHLVENMAGTANLTGVYKVPNIRERVVGAMTNKCPMGAYRGIGYTAPQIARESLIDRAARRLGLSPFEIRRRNVVQPDEFPYTSHNAVVSEGSYLESIERLAAMVDEPAFRERQAASAAEGRLLGLGVSVFNESSGTGTRNTYVTGFETTTHDTSTVRVEPNGTVTVTTSIVSQGQGHETAFAQIAADALGVSTEDVVVKAGDTDQNWGMGTWGSRGGVIAAGSILRAAEPVRERIAHTAAHLLEASPEDIVIEAGVASVAGAPGSSIKVAEVAATLYFDWERRPAEVDPTLQATATFDPAAQIFANGAHAAIVVVDPELGTVQVERVYAVEDCGPMVNPMIVEGQIRGGIVQAVGQALLEELIYDEDGQLLTTTFMDYLVPGAYEAPPIEIAHLETPSPVTPSGMKGMAESAMISAPAAIVNAVNDAIAPLGGELTEVPITPQRLLRAIGVL